jgi:hypothetical protein
MHQFINRAAKRPRLAQQGGDVTKQDARLRIILDRADGSVEFILRSDIDEHGSLLHVWQWNGVP